MAPMSRSGSRSIRSSSGACVPLIGEAGNKSRRLKKSAMGKAISCPSLASARMDRGLREVHHRAAQGQGRRMTGMTAILRRFDEMKALRKLAEAEKLARHAASG
jgi:hypothetical protein